MNSLIKSLPFVLMGTVGLAAEGVQVTAQLTGNNVEGTVTMTETASGAVLVELEATGVPEGLHGFHIHEIGACEGNFESAGGHLARGLEHGVMVEGGPHPGDLPNVFAGSEGTVRAQFFTRGFSLGTEGDARLLDEDGSAVMLHAGVDDYSSQPSGDSGDRLACGVISTETEL